MSDHNRITCVEVHFEDGTVKHMTLEELDLYRRQLLHRFKYPDDPYYAGKEQGLPDPWAD